MTKDEFVAQLERAAVALPGFPVTTAILRQLAELLKRGDPSWWAETQKAWEKRKFVAWTEPWSLFLACVHFEALSDAENPLVPYFPSCGGTAEADPGRALSKFLESPSKRFFQRLKSGHCRPYMEARSSLWISPAALFFQRRGLPYYLVQVNAGAGLDLAADVLSPQKGLDSDLISARIGLDVQPLDLIDIAHRRWLTAALAPDQTVMIATLDRAADRLLDCQRRQPNFIQLVPCDAPAASKFLAKNVPADQDVGLLVFNMGATVRMDDAVYAAYRKGLAELMSVWGDRAVWVEVETVRGELYSTTYQLRANRLLGGALREHVMASFDFGAHRADVDMKSAAQFLLADGMKA